MQAVHEGARCAARCLLGSQPRRPQNGQGGPSPWLGKAQILGLPGPRPSRGLGAPLLSGTSRAHSCVEAAVGVCHWALGLGLRPVGGAEVTVRRVLAGRSPRLGPKAPRATLTQALSQAARHPGWVCSAGLETLSRAGGGSRVSVPCLSPRLHSSVPTVTSSPCGSTVTSTLALRLVSCPSFLQLGPEGTRAPATLALHASPVGPAGPCPSNALAPCSPQDSAPWPPWGWVLPLGGSAASGLRATAHKTGPVRQNQRARTP